MKKTFFLFLVICTQTAWAQSIIVSNVYDANLFELSTGHRVRLAGIAVPSKDSPDPQLKTVAHDALDYARRMLLGQEVKVETVTDSDTNRVRYPEVILWRVFLSGTTDIVERYLEKGYGMLAGDKIPGLRLDEYKDAENSAREWSSGIWGIGSVPRIPIVSRDSLRRSWMAVSDSLMLNYVPPLKQPLPQKIAVPIASSTLSEAQSVSEGLHTRLRIKPQVIFTPMFFLLAWDFLMEASDANDELDALDKLQKDFPGVDRQAMTDQRSRFESIRTRKNVLGYGSIVVGVLNLVFSFETVQVRANGQAITLSYGF